MGPGRTTIADMSTGRSIARDARRACVRWSDVRWSLLAFVLAFSGSTFAAGAHWLTVPHRVCEVHGTIEHGLVSDASVPADPSPDAPVARETEPPHDECTLGPLARMDALPPAHVEVRGQFVAEECGRAFVPAVPTAAVPLFLLAPSRSPPT